MAPLIVLVTATLIARLAGQLGMHALRDWAAATRVGLAVMFCFTAIAHFNVMRADLVRMVPPDPSAGTHGDVHRCMRDSRRDRSTRPAHEANRRRRARSFSNRGPARKYPRGRDWRYARRRAGDAAGAESRAPIGFHRTRLVVRHLRRPAARQS